ncbi:hypothetical protein KRMM14A1004_32370 [Krasilnikovia sp. MM14-A1004]
MKAVCTRLAQVAERIAETARDGARVHDQLVGRLPGAAEHAARQRRLAAAEEAAAVAYRNLEVPPDAVRRAIVECRGRPDGAPPDAWRPTTGRPGSDLR